MDGPVIEGYTSVTIAASSVVRSMAAADRGNITKTQLLMFIHDFILRNVVVHAVNWPLATDD